MAEYKMLLLWTNLITYKTLFYFASTFVTVLDVLKLEGPPAIFPDCLPVVCPIYQYAHFTGVIIEAQKMKEYA